MKPNDYWLECLSQAADEAGIALDSNALSVLAKAAEDGHEHYSMAFYSPSSSEVYQRKYWIADCYMTHGTFVKKRKVAFSTKMDARLFGTPGCEIVRAMEVMPKKRVKK